MDLTTAVEYVTIHADVNTAPALTADEVEAVVLGAALIDSAGLAPSAEGWVETYDQIRATSDAWELRADKASTWVDFSADGTSVSHSQVEKALRKQANRWALRCAAGWGV
jgi:hypothetical protein